jgi:hypothetical protein
LELPDHAVNQKDALSAKFDLAYGTHRAKFQMQSRAQAGARLGTEKLVSGGRLAVSVIKAKPAQNANPSTSLPSTTLGAGRASREPIPAFTPLAISHQPLANVEVDRFIKAIAAARLSRNNGKAQLAIEWKDVVAIYSIERREDSLVVKTKTGEFYTLNLSTGSLSVLKNEVRKEDLLREKDLESKLDELQKANSLLALSAREFNASHVLMIHLNGLNKEAISNLIKKFDGGIGKNTHVVLAGEPQELLLAQRLLDALTLTHGRHFYTALPDDLKNLSTTHLTSIEHLEALKTQFSGDKHQWISTESILDNEKKTAVFAFQPMASLLELVASGDLESARQFFIEITGYKSISPKEFESLVKGDANLLRLYPIHPVLRTFLQEANRLYILARSVRISA